MVSFILHCMNEILCAKKKGFLSTRLSLLHFFSLFEWKLRIKAYIKEEKTLSKIVVKYVLTLQPPIKIKSNKENEVVSHVIPMSFCKDEVQSNHKHTWLIFHKKHKCLLFCLTQNISSRK